MTIAKPFSMPAPTAAVEDVEPKQIIHIDTAEGRSSIALALATKQVEGVEVEFLGRSRPADGNRRIWPGDGKSWFEKVFNANEKIQKTFFFEFDSYAMYQREAVEEIFRYEGIKNPTAEKKARRESKKSKYQGAVNSNPFLSGKQKK